MALNYVWERHLASILHRPNRGDDTRPERCNAKPAAEREIASTDAEIDNLVYELYGITREE